MQTGIPSEIFRALRSEWCDGVFRHNLSPDVQPLDAPDWISAGAAREHVGMYHRIAVPTLVRRPQ